MGTLARARTAMMVLALVGCSARTAPPSSAGGAGEYAARDVPPSVLWIRDVGFDAPESIVHDVASDRYLVSNVAGDALARDDRAFISRVHPNGTVEQLHFIDSRDPAVELHAPKGMVIVGDVLYVADLETIRTFDRASGRPLASIAVRGATFLHDLAADAEGVLYASDSGLGPGYAPSGRDAILRIAKGGTVTPLAQGTALGAPSGLAAADGGLWVATFASGELYFLSFDGTREAAHKPARGSLDGIALLGERVLVSSWEAAAVFERTGDAFSTLFTELDTPADLAIDARRSRLLVTHYRANAVSIHPLR